MPALAVFTQVVGDIARVISSYSPQQKYTLQASKSTSTESCNSFLALLRNSSRQNYLLIVGTTQGFSSPAATRPFTMSHPEF